MKVEYTINNYQMGAKLKSCPTHKIINQERIDAKHIVVIFDDLTQREMEFINKVLAKKGKIL